MILTETKINEDNRRRVERALKEIRELKTFNLVDTYGNKVVVHYPKMMEVVRERYLEPSTYSISQHHLRRIWCDIDIAYMNGMVEERSIQAMAGLVSKFMDDNEHIIVCGYSMDEVGDFCILIRQHNVNVNLQLQPYMYELSLAPGCEQWKHQNITIVA